MLLRHTTLLCNLPSIRRHGLLVSKSQGKLKAVWLHSAEKTTWAFLHVIRRHGGDVQDVVSLDVTVPDELVKRSAADGLFYVLQDVDADQLVMQHGFMEVSASPLQRKAVSRAKR